MGFGGWQFRYNWSGSQAYLILGIILVILGLLFLSPVIRWIMTIIGYVLVALGAIVIALGIINWLSEWRSRREDDPP